MATNDTYKVKVLEKALNILECFSLTKSEWTIKEFSEKLSLNRTTVFRILTTLNSHNFVSVSEETGSYKLGSAIAMLSSVVFNEGNLSHLAGQHLYELSIASGETAHLAIYNNDFTATLIAKHDSLQEIKVTSPIGITFDLHANSMGKIFLAYLSYEKIIQYIDIGLKRYSTHTRVSKNEIIDMIDDIRTNALAFDFGETIEERVGIASPVFDYSNKVIAAVSIVGPKTRVEGNLEALAKKLKETAYKLSKEIGYSGSRW